MAAVEGRAAATPLSWRYSVSLTTYYQSIPNWTNFL